MRSHIENLQRLKARSIVVVLILAASIASFPEALPLQMPGPDIGSFIGQKLILVGHGRESDVTYSGSDLSKSGKSCDGAIEVRHASYSGTQLRFELEDIGSLQSVPNTPIGQRPRCNGNSVTTKISIRDLRPDALTAALKSVSNNLLMTPETYLSRHGITFDYPAVIGNEVPVDKSVAAYIEPKPLLVFQPSYSDAARRARLSGQVRVQFVVGSDGRIQSPVIVKGLGSGLTEQSLRILTLYRFEPAKQNGKAVAISSVVEFGFHLY